MLTNLFSQFILVVFFPVVASFCLILLLLEKAYFKLPNRFMSFISKISTLVVSAVSSSFSGKITSSSMIMFLSIFTLIFTSNLLMPYMFALTSQLVATTSVGMTLWLATIVMGTISKIRKNFEEMVQPGVSPWIMWFSGLVEVISALIRPLTLCCRLTINVTAGHLLVLMMGTLQYTGITHMGLILMFSLEFLVSIIQAFVFMILIVQYLKDSV